MASVDDQARDRARLATTVLVNAASVMERADEQVGIGARPNWSLLRARLPKTASSAFTYAISRRLARRTARCRSTGPDSPRDV